MVTILKVQNLTVSFGEQTVVDGLSFVLSRGESLAVIGPNGSGKTVLLRALLGTVEHQGKISWASDTHIGYVPQKIEADRHLPINLKNLLSAKAKIIGLKDQDFNLIAREVGLSEDATKTPLGHLSGGQFQRALVAFALLGNPNVLILDEPTASIDRPGEEKIYELVHRLQEKYGLTVITVSHDLSFVYRYATKVLCLNKTGICFGTPEETLGQEILEKLYGGPYKYFHHKHQT